MKRVLLLTTIGVLFCVAFSAAQNVFDPADPIVRYSSGAALGTPQHPDPNVPGLQKWVSVASSGVSTGSNSFDASSYKAYFINRNGGQTPFRLKFPKSYTNPDSAGKIYPIMIFFHGAGEPGCPSNGGIYNNERQLLHGGKLFRDRVDNNEFDGFLLYPQNLAGSNCWGTWGGAPFTHYYDDIIAMIDSMAKYARADVNRVLTTGLSDGGAAAWGMMTAFPQRVAKAAPSSAATGATNFADFVHIPIWFASGGKDSNPTPGFAGATYNNIKAAGADIIYTLFPDLGHSVWYDHWQLPGFVAWMNDMNKANPLVYFQRYDFCPDSTINTKIGITRGFAEYEWRKDGVLIATATRTGSNYPYTYSTNIIQPASIISFTANDITVRSFGTYSVRFRRNPGGPWSVWSPKPAVIFSKVLTATPPITVDGLHSKVLPAPDGSNTTPLVLPSGFVRYEWYRNDAFVDTGRKFNAIPGIYKAKTFEQFGCGSDFSPAFTVVAANGEPKPDPAINLTANVEDLINIRLHWNQNPNAGQNETGFEIYRSTGGSGGPYELLAIAPQDASEYLDANRPSNANFYYIVRAVGDFGAAVASNEASVTTPSDNVPPTPPSNLTMPCVTREKVTLVWSPSTDNVGVTVYDIYVNGEKWYSTTNTRFDVYQLTPLTQYAFTVKAKDAAGNSSQPSNQVAAFTRAQGLCYKVYQGEWEFLPDFNSMTPVKEGMSPNVDLNVRPSGVNDNFGILWEGHLFRQSSSVSNHRFRICSDDGSKFYFGYYNPNANGTLNNDGLHGNECETSGSNTSLSLGQAYPIALAYFERGGDQTMTFQWQVRSSSSSPYVTVPDAAFTESGSGGTAPNAPSSLTATAASYNQINLNWNDNSNNETGFEVVRATASAGPFLPLATVTSGHAYSDTGLTASTQYWYRVRAINISGQSAFTSTATTTTQAPPPGPTAPTNLVASSPALATVQLTWNDNSNNETGFEIWRSAGNNTQFQLLTTVPGGAGSQKTYLDGPVFANVHYYYKVRAAGSPTPSGYTGEATISTANTPPEMSPVQDFTVRQGTSVSIPVHATDPDGDPLTFSAPGLPYFAQFEEVSNGNANLVVNPPLGEQGGYTLRLIVDDGFGGKDTVRFTIVVNDNHLPNLNPIADVTVNEGDSVFIPVTATDAEMSQYFSWAFKNKPSFASFTDNGNGSGVIKLKPGYAAAGIYNMTVEVDDGFGAWTSRSFNIVVVETDPNESIQISMGYFSPPTPLWNIVQLQGASSFNLGNLRNKKNEVTTVGIRSLTTGGGISASDHGMQPGNGVYPDPVMKSQLQVGYGGGSDQMDIEVYGLDPLKKYNFIFFASDNGAESWRGYNANTVTTYSINGITATVHVFQNTNETDTIYQITPNAQGRVTITMRGDPSGLIGGLLNALVVEAQFDDGTTPAKPTNMTAQVIPNVGVNLTWNDVAYNENSYTVFRSTSRSGPYTALTPDALRDSVHYLDNSTAPFTQYFYYVRGVNHLGMGPSSDTVDAVTSNNNPLISGLNDIYVKTGATAQDDFSVSDNAGDVLTVTVLDKPSYVTLSSLGGNNYRITASPTIDNIGWDYITVEVKDDKGGSKKQQIGITVADASTRSVFINFGVNEPAPAPWNNVLGYGNINTTRTNMVDETNTPTPFGFVLLDGWDNVTENGQRTGNNSGVFPDSVIAGGYLDFGQTPMRIRFTGLNQSMRYNIVLFGSQNEGFPSVVEYSTGTVKDTLDARNNSNSTANLNNLTPDANGWITVTMTLLNGNAMYLNGGQIEEFAPTSIIRQPLNLFVEGRTDRTSVSLIWSDRSSNETGFQVQRATDSLFTTGVATTNVFANSSSLSNSGVTAGLANNTRYWYRVRAMGPGGTFSDWSNRVKVITPQSIVYINFNFSVPDGPSPWNNTDALPNFTNTFGGLINQSGAPTSMTMSIEKIFNGEYAFGVVTGNNSGVVPDNVLQASYWIDRGQVAEIRLKGLNQDKRYRIGFTGGIDNSLFSGDMTMSYTINGRTVYLNSFFNTTKMVWIGDIVPTDAGEILITFSTPLRNNIVYGFTSAMVVQSYDDPIGGQVPNAVRQSGNPEVVLQSPETIVPEGRVNQQSVDARMYPNPFTDQINLDFNNTAAGNNIAVDVYDMTGRLVYRRNFGRLPAGYNTVRLNTAEGRLNTGVYMVTLTVNGKPVQATKMIKDKK